MTPYPKPVEANELESAMDEVNVTDLADVRDAAIDDMPTIVLPMQLSMLEDSARTDV